MNASTVVNDSPAGKERYYDEEAIELRDARVQFRSYREYLELPPPLPRPYVKALTFLSDEEKESPLFQPLPRYRPEEWVSDAELLANNRWIARVQRILQDRRHEYLPRQTDDETQNLLPTCKLLTKPSSPELNPNISYHSNSQSAVHRTLRIPEIRELKITLASADTLLSAWTVCLAWQDTVRYIIELDLARLYVSHPCPPLNYRDHVDPAFQWLVPSDEELARLEDDLADAQRLVDDMPSTRFEIVPRYFPARLTESLNLRQEVSARSKRFDWAQEEYSIRHCAIKARNALVEGRDFSLHLPHPGRFPPAGMPWPVHSPQWVDLSQFKLNPYFEVLFGDRISYKDGRYDIMLRKSSHMRLYDKHVIPDDLLALLNSMHNTQPPNKHIFLYVWKAKCFDEGSHTEAYRVFLVKNEHGVRVNQLLEALNEVLEIVLQRFSYTINSILFYSTTMHWKHDIWKGPGRPMISIVFSDTVGLSYLQKTDYRGRVDQQGEWMPAEMLRPPVQVFSEDEEADVLPGIYKIGLNAPLFKDRHTTLHERREDYRRVIERIVSNVENGRHCSDGIAQGKPSLSYEVDCVVADEEDHLDYDEDRWEARWDIMFDLD